MKKIFPFLLIPLILAILSFLTIYHLRNGIIASGESSIYINPQYYNYLSSWEEKINFGLYSSHQSNIVLYIIFWNIFKLFSFIVHPSVIFIFLSYFLSGLFFYIVINKIFRFENRIISLPAVLLYTFNPFRMTSPINERLHLLFIFLPLFMYIHYRLLNTGKWKYVFALVTLSWLSSSTGANPPVFTIPYLLIFLQFVFALLFHIKHNQIGKTIFQHIALMILIFVVNFFWIQPTIINLLAALNDSAIKGNLFLALGSGTFLDHFRFIGSWAWRSGHMGKLYYPFSVFFDQPIIFVISIAVSLSILCGYLLPKKVKSSESLQFYYFMMTLYPISLILLAGEKGPGGIIVKLLYKYVPFFLIYREPFTKFAPLFVLSSSVLLTITTSYLYRLRSKLASRFFLATLILSILLLATPIFLRETSPDRAWSGGQAGYLVKIPSYWDNAKRAIEGDPIDGRVFLSPFTLYGNSHNWSYGVGTANDVSEYLINKPIVKAWTFDDKEVNKIINQVFDTPATGSAWLSKYLGFLNVNQILQMNELDWRYSNGRIKPPSEANRYLSLGGLSLYESFGQLSMDYLEKSDLDPDLSRRQNLLDELSDKPALSIYKVNKDDFVPHLFVPQQILFTNKGIDSLPAIIISKDWLPASAIFFDASNSSTLKVKTNNPPTLEYKKISSTKYKVIVHRATSTFPLVFMETFHPHWQIFIQKHESEPTKKSTVKKFISENLHGTTQNDNLNDGIFYKNWFKTSIVSEKNHQEINGFANLWSIDPDKICSSSRGLCKVNSDNSVDIQLVIEFSEQKYLVLHLFLSAVVLTICLLFLLRELFKQKNQ